MSIEQARTGSSATPAYPPYGQTFDSQLEQRCAAGCSSRNIYREKVTGARADRCEVNRMVGKLAPGDVVTVTRIERLARSTIPILGRAVGRRAALFP